MSVDRCCRQNVRTEVWPESLSVFHQLAHEISTPEAVSDVPSELRQDAEKCCDEIGDAEVQDEEVHAG